MTCKYSWLEDDAIQVAGLVNKLVINAIGEYDLTREAQITPH